MIPAQCDAVDEFGTDDCHWVGDAETHIDEPGDDVFWWECPECGTQYVEPISELEAYRRAAS